MVNLHKLQSFERLGDSEYSAQNADTQQSPQAQTCSLTPPQTLSQIWRQRYQTRRQLKALLLNDSDRLHDDLGISARTALAEIKKPFWQA